MDTETAVMFILNETLIQKPSQRELDAALEACGLADASKASPELRALKVAFLTVRYDAIVLGAQLAAALVQKMGPAGRCDHGHPEPN
jgi:hypothetical protein